MPPEPASGYETKPAAPECVKATRGDVAVVRFYPNGRVACWRAEGRGLKQIRELDGRTRERWPAIVARLAAEVRYWFNANGREKPIAVGDVEGFVRTQRGWT